jgi:hypothetical protein
MSQMRHTSIYPAPKQASAKTVRDIKFKAFNTTSYMHDDSNTSEYMSIC